MQMFPDTCKSFTTRIILLWISKEKVEYFGHDQYASDFAKCFFPTLGKLDSSTGTLKYEYTPDISVTKHAELIGSANAKQTLHRHQHYI